MVQSTEKLDWERILWQLAEKGALVMGWFAFSILRKSYGVRVPQKFLQSSSAQVGFLRRMILSRNLKLTKWFNQSETGPVWRVGQKILFGAQKAQHLAAVP